MPPRMSEGENPRFGTSRESQSGDISPGPEEVPYRWPGNSKPAFNFELYVSLNLTYAFTPPRTATEPLPLCPSTEKFNATHKDRMTRVCSFQVSLILAFSLSYLRL